MIKANGPYQTDVMHWKEWPIVPPFLISGAVAYNQEQWFITWRSLDQNRDVDEILRNLPVRSPAIWF